MTPYPVTAVPFPSPRPQPTPPARTASAALTPAPAAPVPRVRLFVERAGLPEHWFVHVGHVTQGGRRRTAPHAHPGYGQVIFVREGRGTMNLDGERVPFEAPCALLLPHDCVHGLEYELDVDRWVVTVEQSFLAQVNAKLPEFVQLWSQPRVLPLAGVDAAAAQVHGLFQGLQQESRARAVGHVIGTEALLTSLLLALVRGVRTDEVQKDTATRAAIRLVDRFRELIHRHYAENLRQQDYASKMAVSPAQLRAACLSATGLSPTKLIHARLVMEAKRHLVFSDQSIEQIAYALGFVDTAYFTRFFRREVGHSPSQFRAHARAQAQRQADPLQQAAAA